jgi:hypothetical protein
MVENEKHLIGAISDGLVIQLEPCELEEHTGSISFRLYFELCNQKQRCEFEYLGVWIAIDELLKFEAALRNESFIELKDLSDYVVFSIKKFATHVQVIINPKNDRMLSGADKMYIEYTTANEFITKLHDSFINYPKWW